MTSTKRLFSGKGITCMRGERVLFQNLSFGLSPGDIVHLSGPNGAGKTSLLRVMCGALPIEEGSIFWEGMLFLENGMEEHARRFSFLPSDDRSLKPLESAEENLSFWAKFWGLEAEESVVRALKKMDLLPLKDMPVRHLSAGQKRRLGLSRAFLRAVPLWLLDEPLNGLDSRAHDLFMTALGEHCARGGMAVIASHHAMEPPRSGTLQRVDVRGA